MIRPLTTNERSLRVKYVLRVEQRKAELHRAMTALAAAQEMLNDLALAFHGGDGPVMMTEDGLYEVQD